MHDANDKVSDLIAALNDHKPVTLAQVQKAVKDLVELGLVQDSGRRENGRIVYVLTPFAKSIERTNAALSFSK